MERGEEAVSPTMWCTAMACHVSACLETQQYAELEATKKETLREKTSPTKFQGDRSDQPGGCTSLSAVRCALQVACVLVQCGQQRLASARITRPTDTAEKVPDARTYQVVRVQVAMSRHSISAHT